MTAQTSIRKERFYPHSINAVWSAISVQEQLSKWFVNADFKAEVGYQYTFTRGENTITGEVLDVQPPHLLTYTWVIGDPNVITTVKWELQEVDGGTLVIIDHTGISGYASDQIAAATFNHFNHGWEDCTNRLAKHLQQDVHVS